MKFIIECEPDDTILLARAATKVAKGEVRFPLNYHGRQVGFVDYENGYQVSICKNKGGYSMIGSYIK